ncbi:MAG: DNA polymerase IV [Spirochaetaceae bacterium]|nr:MAG: DNA polymerase IV [Spirochaetaceae bacterium]
MERVFFHVDMDAFYASVEQMDDPTLRGKPVLVGGRSGRGVVAACSYEARRHGIHSAMPMSEAIRRCPEARVVPVRMSRYRELSRTITERFSRYTPIVQVISIDEAFLDMTGTERLLGSPESVALRLKDDIRAASGGLTVSVGIGSSRLIAKLASEVNKPDGLYRVPPGNESAFVSGLELKDLWGLGRSTRRRLESLGISTVRALREQRPEFLRGHFGQSNGDFLYRVCRGEDPGIHRGHRERHSISAEETFERDIADEVQLRREMTALAEEVIQRSIQERWRGRTVQVKFRYPSFETHTASRTLPDPPEGTKALARVALDLLEPRRGGRPLRLLGVGIAGDARTDTLDGPRQASLFEEERTADDLDPVVAALRERFGPEAIRRADTV